MIRIGTKIENITFTKREGAYAIIEREDNKIAIATADNDLFFLVEE